VQAVGERRICHYALWNPSRIVTTNQMLRSLVLGALILKTQPGGATRLLLVLPETGYGDPNAEDARHVGSKLGIENAMLYLYNESGEW
jgi:hypothetical protein